MFPFDDVTMINSVFHICYRWELLRMISHFVLHYRYATALLRCANESFVRHCGELGELFGSMYTRSSVINFAPHLPPDCRLRDSVDRRRWNTTRRLEQNGRQYMSSSFSSMKRFLFDWFCHRIKFLQMRTIDNVFNRRHKTFASLALCEGIHHVTTGFLLYQGPVMRKAFPWQRRHNEGESASNHQPHECLPNHLFRLRSRKTSNLRVTGLCAGNSPVTGEFLAQMASNAENVSIWWRHHDFSSFADAACSRNILWRKNIRLYRDGFNNSGWIAHRTSMSVSDGNH